MALQVVVQQDSLRVFEVCYYTAIIHSFTSPVNLSAFNTSRTWFVRCNRRSYGHLRLRRRNSWQVKRGEGRKEKEVLQISASAYPSHFRVEAAPLVQLIYNASIGLLAKHVKWIQRTCATR